MMPLTDLAAQPLIRLAAIDTARNMARSYRITRSADLFGWQLVCWQWGRIGARPLEKRLAFATEADAIACVRRLLARRTSAPHRIGVAYRPF